MNLKKNLRGLIVALVGLFTLAACSSGAGASAPAASPSESSSGQWSYTDDTGKTVTLPTKPTKVAGFADQVLTLMSYGVKPVAVFGRVDVKTDPRFAGVDLTGVTILGNPYGEIDLVAKRRNLVAFIEVKARASLDDAAYAVTPRQQARIIDAAQAWLMAHPEHAEFELRFDAILIAPRHLPRHLIAAFDASV